MSAEINPYEPPQTAAPSAEVADPTETPRFQSHSILAMVAVIALVASALLASISLAFNLRLLTLYRHAASFAAVDTDRENQLFGAINAAIAGLVVLRIVVTIPSLLAWMYGCHRNLVSLGNDQLDSKPVWAVLCWFIPFMNLFCPYQVMHEIWWRSDPRMPTKHDPKAGSTILTIWWGCWVLSLVLTPLANSLDKSADTVAAASAAAWTDVALLGALVAAALLLCVIILTIQRRQVLRYAALAH